MSNLMKSKVKDKGADLEPGVRLRSFYQDLKNDRGISLERMAARLRLEPKFGSVNRGTLWRWMEGGAADETINAALQILQKAFPCAESLRVSVPTAPEALPVLLIQPPPDVQGLL